ncbi:MAG: histidine kinase dimerization/phospho-acceptor domain-containing protein, partial [Gammaproteobacteria bacterium]
MDATGQVVLANDRIADLTQMSTEDLKQLTLPQIVELFRNLVQDSLRFIQQMNSLPDIAPLAAELVFPLANSRGNLRVYSMPVFQVESPRPRGAAAAAERTEDEELEHLKKEFISTVSHELRTSLTAIKGALGLALGGAAGPLGAELRELLELAEKNTDRLIDLINDILDMFRLETGRLPMRMESIAVEESIQHEISIHWTNAEKNKITLEAEIEPDLPLAKA